MKKLPRKKKLEIVEKYLCGNSVINLSNEYDLARSTIYSFIKRHHEEICNHPVNLRDFTMLQKMKERKDLIVHILQTAPCTANAPLREKLQAIKDLSGKYNVNTLCEAFEVSKGTYYNHVLRSKGENSETQRRRAMLKPIIEEIFMKSNCTFGAGKVTAVLKDRGYVVSERIVAEIMHSNEWFSVKSNAKTLYEYSNRKKENILRQNFTASKPNEIWVSDITYFNLGFRKYYICVILDLYSRKIIACKISKHNSTTLTKSTFNFAYANRRPEEGLIFHSDNGSNYTSHAFYTCLKECGAKQSFSRTNRPHDNAVSESFFKCMKAEELYRYRYKSERELVISLNKYVDFYNQERPHTYLGYMTPNKYEDLYKKTCTS